MSDDETASSKSSNDDELLTPVETLCCQLRRNAVADFDIPDNFGSDHIQEHYDDLLATSLPFLLAGSLMGNTSLKTLRIELKAELTELGARALVEGIRHSDIQSLNITTCEDDTDAIPTTFAIWTVLVESTKYVPKIDCCFGLWDAHICLLGAALRGNKTLHHFSICPIHNITANGLYLLFAGIRCSQITSLQLEVWRDVMDNFSFAFFLEGFMTLPTVRKLTLKGNWDSYQRVSQKKPGQRSSFSEGVGTDIILLKAFHLLEELSIDDFHLNVRDMTILAQGLGILKSLILADNGIADAGVKAFVENWDNQSHLETLLFFSNTLALAGVCTMLRESATRPSFNKLRLWLNQVNIGFHGLAEISPLLAASHLSEFDISIARENRFDSKSLKAQQEAEAAEAAGRALLRATKSNYTLQEVTLDSIDIDAKYKKEIQFHLELNKGGRIRLMEHGFAPTLWCHALAKFQNDASTICYYLREFPGLVSWFPSNDGNKRRYRGRSSNSRSKDGKNGRTPAASKPRKLVQYVSC